jgi:hypothetical protein
VGRPSVKCSGTVPHIAYITLIIKEKIVILYSTVAQIDRGIEVVGWTPQDVSLNVFAVKSRRYDREIPRDWRYAGSSASNKILVDDEAEN